LKDLGVNDGASKGVDEDIVLVLVGSPFALSCVFHKSCTSTANAWARRPS